MPTPQRVTCVASDATPQLSELLAAIEANGYPVSKTARLEQLSTQLDEEEASTILVYAEQGNDLASRVLTQLDGQQSKCPVIVVVDRADFTHYYELMCEGAYDYFELAEGSDVIARAVRWAAKTRAS